MILGPKIKSTSFLRVEALRRIYMGTKIFQKWSLLFKLGWLDKPQTRESGVKCYCWKFLKCDITSFDRSQVVAYGSSQLFSSLFYSSSMYETVGWSRDHKEQVYLYLANLIIRQFWERGLDDMNDDYDEFGADADFLEALAATDPTSSITQKQNGPLITQPTPQRLARLDQAPPQIKSSSRPKVVQPTPQILTSRPTISSILVSPRQKGNPVLTNLRSFVWEYSDIPADYILGSTTCALFLSLKYHRLHPEYVYNRIKGLYGKYNLRILLTLVDINNHEDPIKELTKTCLVNNVTFILCWSAAEAARYLELYKSFEHSKDLTGIKGIEKKSYAEKMVEFITVPRGINKTDAVSLVSAFGSIKGAIHARPEEIAIIGGWGEKKVKRWCSVVNEPFRVRRTQIKRKTNSMGNSDKFEPLISAPTSQTLDKRKEIGKTSQQSKSSSVNVLDPHASSTGALEHLELDFSTDDDNDDNIADLGDSSENLKKNSDIEALAKAGKTIEQDTKKNNEELSTGISAALAKLRRETGDS